MRSVTIRINATETIFFLKFPMFAANLKVNTHIRTCILTKQHTKESLSFEFYIKNLHHAERERESEEAHIRTNKFSFIYSLSIFVCNCHKSAY